MTPEDPMPKPQMLRVTTQASTTQAFTSRPPTAAELESFKLGRGAGVRDCIAAVDELRAFTESPDRSVQDDGAALLVVLRARLARLLS